MSWERQFKAVEENLTHVGPDSYFNNVIMRLGQKKYTCTAVRLHSRTCKKRSKPQALGIKV